MYRMATAFLLGSFLVLPFSSPSVSSESVVGRLVLRDYQVTMTIAPSGTRYTIATSDGTELAANLSIEELRSRYPQVHDQLEPAIAAPKPIQQPTMPQSTLMMVWVDH
jgi:hypothetical protein